jgi:hypothetical protein
MRWRAKTDPQIEQITQTTYPGALIGKRKFCLTGGNEK